MATTRVNKPKILSFDLRSRRGKGEVPLKMMALASYQHRLRHFTDGQQSYDAEIAKTLYLERRVMASCLNRRQVDGNELAQLIATKLTIDQRGSPEQIVHDLAKATGISLSYQTIYRYIKQSDNCQQLEQGLRRCGKHYRYSSTSELRWHKTKDNLSIHTRPIEIEELTRCDDLEGDTIFGKDTKDRPC